MADSNFNDTSQPPGASPYLGSINKYAQQYGIDPRLMLGIGATESGFNPTATNPNSTASGMFQITRPTWSDLTRDETSPMDPFNPENNIQMAAKYLQQLKGRAGGDPRMMAAMYNQGPNADPAKLQEAMQTYGAKATQYMQPGDDQGGMFQEGPHPDEVLDAAHSLVNDPSDAANNPPSLMDPIRISGEAAQVLQGMDPRVMGQFGAILAQQMMMQENAYRLTKQQQLMALAQTFAPYGQDRAAEVAMGYQQQNMQKYQNAQQGTQQVENRQARIAQDQQARQQRQEDLQLRRWDGLEKELRNAGIDKRVYDTDSENAAKSILSRNNLMNKDRKDRMANTLLRLREEAAENRKRITDAMLKRYTTKKLSENPQYTILQKNWENTIDDLDDLQRYATKIDEKDWFNQGPGIEAKMNELKRQKEQYEAQMMAYVPDEMAPNSKPPTTTNESEDKVSDDELRKELGGSGLD